MLSVKARHGFYIVFAIMGMFLLTLCAFALCILCQSEMPFRHKSQLDEIIDSYVTKQEAAAKPAAEQVPDGAALGDHFNARDGFVDT